MGKTVDEAINEALKELNITADEADIMVIDEGSKGFLGMFGGKNAVVRKGKAVRQIVKRRSEIKPLQRSAYTGLHQSFRHVRQVLLNVFRIVSVEKPVFY